MTRPGIALAFALVMWIPVHAGAALTQERVNEYAAACVRAQIALQGAGEPAPPSETPAARAVREAGYRKALAAAITALKPLGKAPALRDRTPANAARWALVARCVAMLPRQVHAAVRPPAPGVSPDADAARRPMRVAVQTVRAVRGALRDARP